ncbi:hypothetical protein F5Y14DRAFT_445474 [Nemania sp. NC0429]|nr:hypothetical protein F5Y14DRAFT_445474 [Nemania sp. NC0429]
MPYIIYILNPAWSCMDDESLALILSLLSQDADQMKSSSKGKQVEGTLTDADLALQLYNEELSRVTTYASDRRMTKSLQDAVQADTDAILEFQREENIAQNDRALAVSQSEGTTQAPPQIPVDAGPSAAELDQLQNLLAFYVIGNREQEGDYDTIDNNTEMALAVRPESSSSAAARGSKDSKLRPCVACGDMRHFVYLVRAPCQHEYCRECLQNLFRHAISDETMFPPRCCRQDIPLAANRLFLGDDLVQEFKKKSIEFSTPNRTYCHQPTCSTFISTLTIKDGVASCPECNATTCTTCKKATHNGGDCPADTELQTVLQMGREENWQRCPQCKTMVELRTGCFHMRCKCRAEFCYLCGAEWKTCACVQFDEARLLARTPRLRARSGQRLRGQRWRSLEEPKACGRCNESMTLFHL